MSTAEAAARRAIGQAKELMLRFAERTGVTSGSTSQRYLWTDAFAVCNFLGLAQETGEQRYTELALRLVEQVHHVLGRYRDDDSRTGWISGLDARDGEMHPTRGGLRIGKALPERGVSEPVDEQLEWHRDGQYFHYLTKWMHALDQVSRWTGQPQFNVWARELASVAHDAFARTTRGGRRMVWKMSTDLSRPLVSSTGHHDPLDGFITCIQLQATRLAFPDAADGPTLNEAVLDFTRMIEGQDWATTDPLGLGGLLVDAARASQLIHFRSVDLRELLRKLLDDALLGLAHYARQGHSSEAASQRLAFREIGLAIGLSAIALIEEIGNTEQRSPSRAEVQKRIAQLQHYVPIGSTIESFWLEPEHRATRTWSEHRDINEVMLATSLSPAGFLIMGGRSTGAPRGARGHARNGN